MYQIIENKQDFSKLMENLPKELKILEVPEFNKKLEIIVNAFEMNLGGDGNHENNVEGYIIILYGKKEEVLGEYKRILSYRYTEKENNGAEDGMGIRNMNIANKRYLELVYASMQQRLKS